MPIGVVASGRVCACSLQSRLVYLHFTDFKDKMFRLSLIQYVTIFCAKPTTSCALYCKQVNREEMKKIWRNASKKFVRPGLGSVKGIKFIISIITRESRKALTFNDKEIRLKLTNRFCITWLLMLNYNTSILPSSMTFILPILGYKICNPLRKMSQNDISKSLVFCYKVFRWCVHQSILLVYKWLHIGYPWMKAVLNLIFKTNTPAVP